MKSLTLVYLAAAAAAAVFSFSGPSASPLPFANAAETSFCFLTEPSSWTQTLTAGDRKYGNMCLMAGNRTLVFDGSTNPPKLPAYGGASAQPALGELTLGTVSAGTLVMIRGCATEAEAAKTVAYQIKIGNLAFMENAGIVVEGSFGKGSDIEITQNTFTNVNGKLTPQYGESVGLFGILLFSTDNNVQRLCEGARVRIHKNDFTFTSKPDEFSGYGIRGLSDFNMEASSVLDLSENIIRIRNTRAGAVGTNKNAVGIALSGTVRPISDGATVTIDNNRMEVAYGIPIYLPAISSPSNTITVSASSNELLGQPASATIASLASVSTVVQSMMIFAQNVNIGKASVFDIRHNNMTAYNSDGIVITQQLTLAGSAAANYEYNDIRVVANGTAFFGFQNAVSAAGTSTFTLDLNTMSRNDDKAATAPGFFFGSGFTLKDSSVTSFGYNSFDVPKHRAIAEQQALIGVTAGRAVTKDANAKLYVCANSHYNAFVTSSASSVVLPSDIRSIASVGTESDSQCAVRRRVTTTPAPPTTMAPIATAAPGGEASYIIRTGGAGTLPDGFGTTVSHYDGDGHDDHDDHDGHNHGTTPTTAKYTGPTTLPPLPVTQEQGRATFATAPVATTTPAATTTRRTTIPAGAETTTAAPSLRNSAPSMLMADGREMAMFAAMVLSTMMILAVFVSTADGFSVLP